MLKKFFTKERIVLLLILLLAFALRLYKIDNPIADWHSWRQADTAAVSRSFIEYGFHPLYPRFEDLSNSPSRLENPQGWRFVEFPIFNLIHAGFFKLIGIFNLDIWGRLTAVVASLFSLFFLYLIIAKFWGKRTGLFSVFFFAVLPFNIFYSRAILPEPLMIAFSLGAIYFFEANWTISLLLGILALLTKPYAVFIMALPMAYLVINKFWENRKDKKETKKIIISAFLYAILVFIPLVLWRIWMRQFPEGIPSNQWLFNAGNMRLKPVWWRWLFYERIGKLILGGWGTFFLALGLMGKKKKYADRFFYSFILGSLLFLIVIARGNIQHDYYQALIIPAICIYLGRGLETALYQTKKKSYSIINYLLLTAIFVFTLAFSWYEVKGYYQINNPVIVEAGQKADKILPSNAKIIAPYQGDTAFLYQTNRPGWPLITSSIKNMINLGATHYVSVNFDETTKEIMEKYKILEKTDRYVIVELEKIPKFQNSKTQSKVK